MSDRTTALKKLGFTKPPQITEAELKTLTSDEISYALEQGQLVDLMGGQKDPTPAIRTMTTHAAPQVIDLNDPKHLTNGQ